MSFYDKVIRINDIEIETIKETTTFDKPKIYGCFSLDKDRNYIPGPKNMVYYYPRFDEIEKGEGRFELNLNKGIERVVRKPENLNEKLDHLLRFIEHHKHLFVLDENKLINADFICYRGLLTKIMCSVHLQDEWTIYATKWKGNIYLCEGEKNVTYYISKSDMEKFSSWGYKFEQYMVTDKLGVAPDTSKPVYESEEFCCVYKSKIGSHKLVYGAELDAINSEKEIDLSKVDWNSIEFVELKTNKEIERPNDDRNIKHYKYIKWWCQCFLVNIQQIHCGFRDKNGIVRNIIKYNVRDLPRISNNMWGWKTCLNFCNIFLDIVKDIIPEDTSDPYTVWKFEWKPQFRDIKYQELKGRSPHTFLPQWYIDRMSKT